MHYAIAAVSIFACWRWGDWKHWRIYWPTLLYVAVANLTYSYLVDDKKLWVFHNNGTYRDQKIVDLLYFYIITPSIAFMFLSHRPRRARSYLWVLPLWIGGFTLIEYTVYLLHGISYHHGWTIGWSCLFYTIMFPMLLLHFYKPLWAYPVSIAITAFYIIAFDVPLLGR